MKAMILFSGGLDSTTALAMAVREYGAENLLNKVVCKNQL